MQEAPRVVWIYGERFCDRAKHLAKRQGILLSCGTQTVQMVWKVAPHVTKHFRKHFLLQSEGKVIRRPDMVVIYLDDAEVRSNSDVMVTTIKREMKLLRTIFPKCLIVWCDILPQCLEGSNPTATTPGIDYINARLHAVVTKLGGKVVTHGNIGPDLYHVNGNYKYFTDAVTERINLNIQEFVVKWLTEVSALAQHTKPSPPSPPRSNALGPHTAYSFQNPNPPHCTRPKPRSLLPLPTPTSIFPQRPPTPLLSLPRPKPLIPPRKTVPLTLLRNPTPRSAQPKPTPLIVQSKHSSVHNNPPGH